MGHPLGREISSAIWPVTIKKGSINVVPKRGGAWI